MFYEILILASPVAGLGLGMCLVSWDTRRWNARVRAAARPVSVRPFPHGGPRLAPPLDPRAGRAARRARRAGAR